MPHLDAGSRFRYMTSSRVASLDYVRGLAALSILLYHYQSWIFGNFDAASIWGRLGLYGVGLFYVLSGLTLYHVYEQRLKPQPELVSDFYLKRLFRIFPLLWLVMTVYLVRDAQYAKAGWGNVFYNFTGLFGLLDWNNAIGVGVWSIGNELTFYLLFPVFIFVIRYSRPAFLLLSLLLMAIGLYFAFFGIAATTPLADQWRDYTNPLNQAFLFLGGFCIGHFSKHRNYNSKLLLLVLLLSIAVFCFYPAAGETATLVSGMNRLIFSSTCLAACWCMYKLPVSPPALVDGPLKKLGEVSYALYLLHPIVYNELTGYGANKGVLPPWQLLFAATGITLLLSLLVYRFYEQPFIRFGQRTSRLVSHKFAQPEVPVIEKDK